MTRIDFSIRGRGAHAKRAAPRASARRLAALLASSFALLLAAGCAPEPRNTPCSNAGDCEKAGPGYQYCLQSRCVECVSSSSCGEGNTCVDGACEIHCHDDRGCRNGGRCKDGLCAQ